MSCQTPYHVGFEFVVREHQPPSANPDVLGFPRDKLLPGKFGEKELRLRVCQELRVGPGNSGQLVVVKEVLSGQPPEPPGSRHREPDELGPSRVAKLYDSRYLFRQSGQMRGQAVRIMDDQYVRECAAYRHLRHHGLHRAIPQFYGSWSTHTDDPTTQERCEVRLILIEMINGRDMDMMPVPPVTFSLADRQAIMRRVIEIDSQFYACDLSHRDLYPRNVIISRADPQDLQAGEALQADGRPPLRVTVIDFGLARIGRYWADIHVYDHSTSDLLKGTYISPILRWWQVNDRIDRWAGWVTWDWNKWLVETFRADIPHITRDMLKWIPAKERKNQFFRQFESRGSCSLS